MPAIQKIRKHGALLICIIGAALFAFIAEEAVRSMETTSNASKQQVGEVYGQALNYQDFQEMVNNELELAKMQNGGQSLSDQQTEQVRDRVWNEFLQYQLIKHEADGLGLIVTDEEMQQALREGQAQSLVSILPMFVQNGHFDYTALKSFLEQYNKNRAAMQGEQMEQFELIHRLWLYAEGKLRRELLIQKYGMLFESTMLSNPLTAEQNFNDRATTTTGLVAALPYKSITDKVQVTDDELKAAYETYKEQFFVPFETRDIKYIDVAVTASKNDKDELDKEMQKVYDDLSASTDVNTAAAIIGGSKSSIRFTDMPLPVAAFPQDIAQKLETAAVGHTIAPYKNDQDNTVNVIKLISKVQTADSICCRILPVMDQDGKAAERKDSIMNALNAGGDFKAIAKKYGVPSDSSWISTKDVRAGISPDDAKLIKALTEKTGTFDIEYQGRNLVVRVENTKGSSVKYVAAVCKCDVAFSKTTYNDAKNKMNLFMSKNKDLASVEKAAAKNGYKIVDCAKFSSAAHYIGADGRTSMGVAGTKDAVKWVFDDAKVGEISKMYECGDANDHILIVGVSAIHKKGYQPWDDKDVKATLTSIIASGKKGEIAKQKLAKAKTVEDAHTVCPLALAPDSISGSFMNLAPIASTGAREPKVAAALASLKVNQTSPVIIGSAGAYIVKVVKQEKDPAAKFDAKTVVPQDAQMYMQMAQGFLGELYKKAKVIDNRYKF